MSARPTGSLMHMHVLTTLLVSHPNSWRTLESFLRLRTMKSGLLGPWHDWNSWKTHESMSFPWVFHEFSMSFDECGWILADHRKRQKTLGQDTWTQIDKWLSLEEFSTESTSFLGNQGKPSRCHEKKQSTSRNPPHPCKAIGKPPSELWRRLPEFPEVWIELSDRGQLLPAPSSHHVVTSSQFQFSSNAGRYGARLSFLIRGSRVQSSV